MAFDKILHKLLPKDDRFYKMFEEAIGYIDEAAKELKKLACAPLAERQGIIKRISELEHKGDDITHTILSELNSTFVTPFDSEDIHKLTSELDDILDYIDGSARRFNLYDVTHCPDSMVKLIDALCGSISELKRGIPLLRKLSHTSGLRDVIKRVNDYENEADVIFAGAVADLFKNETNPIEIIKLKEIFVTLETATDKCEDVADVLETILIKHA